MSLDPPLYICQLGLKKAHSHNLNHSWTSSFSKSHWLPPIHLRLRSIKKKKKSITLKWVPKWRTEEVSAMAVTFSRIPSTPNSSFRRNWVFHSPSSSRTPLVCVLKTASSDGGRVTSSHDSYAPSLLRKPVVISHKEEEEGNGSESESESDQWVNWEDRILEETVPLVGFVRTIIHSGK